MKSLGTELTSVLQVRTPEPCAVGAAYSISTGLGLMISKH